MQRFDRLTKSEIAERAFRDFKCFTFDLGIIFGFETVQAIAEFICQAGYFFVSK